MRAALALGVALALLAPTGATAATGAWDRTWGNDVISGGAIEFEICTVAADCQAGRSMGGLGGTMWFPSGVATDTAGNVYVADTSNHRIQKFDSNGNWERAWGKDVAAGGGTGPEICTNAAACQAGKTGDLGGEMSSPRGVATDATGSVYLADTGNDRIQKFDSDGTFLLTWGKGVNGGGGFETCDGADCQAGTPGGFGGEMFRPVKVATDGSGSVYVGDSENHRIQKFDSDGNWDRAWGKDVIDPLAGSDTGTGFEICTSLAHCQAGDVGGLGGELNFPWGVATDASSNVYVGDSQNDRMQKFDSDGNWERAWGKDVDTAVGDGFEICTTAADCKAGESGELGGEMSSPVGVATDASDDVYLADGGRIQKFDSGGNWQRAWGKDVIQGGAMGDLGTGFEICTTAADCKGGVMGGLGGEMNGPEGLATDASADLYVTDGGNSRIQKFGDPPSLPPPPLTTIDLPPPAFHVLNDFVFGGLERNRKRGIAFLMVFFPGPGEVGWGGKGLQGFDLASAAVARKSLAISGGWVRLKVKPAKKGKRARKLVGQLKRKGKAKVKVRITFIPTGGAANTQTRKVKLVRKTRSR